MSQPSDEAVKGGERLIPIIMYPYMRSEVVEAVSSALDAARREGFNEGIEAAAREAAVEQIAEEIVSQCKSVNCKHYYLPSAVASWCRPCMVELISEALAVERKERRRMGGM